MRFAVIIGYVIASIFALCGIINSVQFCLDGRELNMAAFSLGLVIAAAPLAAASVILLLTQILCRLEQLVSAPVAGALPNRSVQPRRRVAPPHPRETPRKTPERFFPIHGAEDSAQEEITEPDSPEQVGDDSPPDEKLRFFKLH